MTTSNENDSKTNSLDVTQLYSRTPVFHSELKTWLFGRSFPA